MSGFERVHSQCPYPAGSVHQCSPRGSHSGRHLAPCSCTCHRAGTGWSGTCSDLKRAKKPTWLSTHTHTHTRTRARRRTHKEDFLGVHISHQSTQEAQLHNGDWRWAANSCYQLLDTAMTCPHLCLNSPTQCARMTVVWCVMYSLCSPLCECLTLIAVVASPLRLTVAVVPVHAVAIDYNQQEL